MLYNLTDILTNEGKEITLTVPYEKDTVNNGYEDYPIVGKSDLSLKLTNVKKGEAQFEGNITFDCEVPCDRCLKPVTVHLSIQIADTVAESDIGDPEAAEDKTYLDGYEIDTDVLIGNEILINWPAKILCKEECLGICTVCGKDLNEGECGCDRFVPDPRMAVIKDIFNA